MSFGKDGLELTEPELNKSLDFQFETVANDASNDEMPRKVA